MNRFNRVDLDSLPPYYQKACTNLQQNLQASATNEEKVEHCETFLQSFFMIPPLWYDFFKLLKFTDALPHVFEVYSNQAISQFYAEELYPKLILSSKPFTKTVRSPQFFFAKTKYMTKVQLEDGLSYPHEHLDNLYHHYIQLTGNPMPPWLYKQYLNSKKIYDKLCEVYENEAEWIKVLATFEDDDFIKQNIEARIAREYINKKIWRLYIQYLNDTNDMWILSVFCRYCNFFIEDLGMREKYLAKIEYYANLEKPVSKWWIDVIAFTFNHGKAQDIKEIILKALSYASVDFSPLHMFLEYDLEDIVPKQMYQELRTEIHKTYDRVVGNRNKKWSDYYILSFLCEKSFINMGKAEKLKKFDKEIYGFNRRKIEHGYNFAPTPVHSFIPDRQFFSFPKPIIRYIMKSPMHIRFKLYKSCKYFFDQQVLVPCYSMKIADFQPPKSISNELSLSTSVEHESFQHLNNLWINGLISSSSEAATLQILMKISILEPCILHLQYQTIPFSTLIELMKNQNCNVLKLVAAFFTHRDGSNATLNEILEACPNVFDFSIRCHLLEINNEELSQMVRKNKIERLTLKFVRNQLEIPSFLQFLKKNAAPLCKVKIFFDETADMQYRIQMVTALRDFKNEMPKFCGKPWICYKIRDDSF